MHLEQICSATQNGERALRAAKNFPVSSDFAADMDSAMDLLSEVRHFARCWDDNRENATSGAINMDTAALIERKLIERLVTFCKPRA